MNYRLTQRHPLIQFIFDNWIYIAVAILIWQLPYLLGDYFDQDIRPRRPFGNQPIFWMGVVSKFYILAILAMSYNLIFGFTGIISFGHALFFGIGVYGVVILMETFAYSLVTSMAVAICLAILLSLVAALAVFRIKGVYFAMFSLAFAELFFLLSRVRLFNFLTKGDDGFSLTVTPDWIQPIQNRLAFYYLSAFLMVLTFVIIRRLMNAPAGKVLVAIRENEQRAETMGYNVRIYKTMALVIGCGFAGLAGTLQAIFESQAVTEDFGLAHTVDPLLHTIIGGIGTNAGPVLGAALLHFGEAFFSKPDLTIDFNFILFRITETINVESEWGLLLGIVFIVVVIFVPFGLVGQLTLLYGQLRRWLRQFVYDPFIRANPNWATRLEPITGENAAVAIALAERSKGKSLREWVLRYPPQATFSVTFIIALLAGLITWDEHTTFDLLLFFWLITIPILLAIWLYRHRDNLEAELGRSLRGLSFWRTRLKIDP